MTRTLTLERQQFEKWWETAMHNGYPPRFGWEHWRDGDGYRDDDGEFQGLWQAWQASRGFLANREAQPVALDVIARFKEWNTGFPVENFKADYVIGWVLANYYAPPAPANAVAWEMRYWNSGHNCWHDWERITAEQHAEMSAEHAADNDYEFRVLYAAPPAPVVPEEISSSIRHLKDTLVACNRFNYCADAVNRVEDACRAAMLAQPVSQRYTLPPHVFRELVNSLRDTAVKYQGTQQLREQLSRTLTDKGLSAAAQEGGNDHDAGR
ncbi:TPA: hypothetical protein ACXM66_000285 [Serratia marcescens]